jgi:rRNA maturation RNase YbeY
MAVRFFKADVSIRIAKSTLLSKFIGTKFTTEQKKQLSLSCILCSDDYLLNINKEFLQHDYYTDIITFPLEDTPKKSTAEIYMSIDRITDNAQKNKTTFENEFQRVLFHGVLHLCGYGDKTKSEKIKMQEMENLWLKAFSKLVAKHDN